MREVGVGNGTGVFEKTFSTSRARSIPLSLNSQSEKGGSRSSYGGYEISVYESKSCESLRQHGIQELSNVVVTRQLLYKEALYTATHMLGKPSTRFPSNQEDILTYVQITFAQEVQEQIDFIQHVTGEAFPLTIVNVGIRRADNLAPRDKNGLADPYCLISVETEESVDKSLWKQIDFGSPLRPKSVKHSKERERPIAENRYDQHYNTIPRSIRTTIEHETLNPVWEQRFQCLALRPSRDILHVEVWDHDNETEAVKSVQAAKDAKMTQEVEQGQSNYYIGKNDDFIGKAMTKISEIPVEGEEKWFHLLGKTHRGIEAQGKLLMQIWLTHSFRHGVHYKSPAPPRKLLEKLWDFILEVESRRHSTGNEVWNGEIPMAATCFLFQYGLQTGISESTQAIIRFNAYTKRNLQIHGTELRLKELDTCIKKYEKLSGESKTGKISHCDQEEMIASLVNSLRSPANVIRTHFTEKQENVIEALKSFRYVLNILERIGNRQEIEHVSNELKVALRIGVLEWYQDNFLENVKGASQDSKMNVICSLAKVVRNVNEKLYEGNQVWKTAFWMESSVDYMSIIYDEFQKMIIHDVEAVTWSTLRIYNDNEDLRKILLEINPEHKAICRCLFELYVETQHFVLFHNQILPNSNGRRGEVTFAHLDEYHTWFRPVLVLWMGFAFIRAHDLISACILHDEMISGDQTVLTTSSAVDTVFVFQQLASFRQELNWPDPSENFVVAMFIVEVMTYMSVLYARIKRHKIDKEGYFDTQDRFDISERLCRALNNIQYVQETVQNAPRDLKIDKILEDLEETVGEGSETWTSSHTRIINSLSTAIVETEKEIVMIVGGIGNRVRPEIKNAWEQCLTRLDQNVEATDHMEPLYNYLEYNLRILHDFLFHVNFLRLVQMFWIVICQELVSAVSHFPSTTTLEQQIYFGNLQSLLPALIDYLQGNGEGLTAKQVDCPDFVFAQKYLQMFTLDSQALKTLFYFERANEQIGFEKVGKLGSLDTRVTFFNGKLRVEVISVINLVPMDHPSKIWEICRKLSPPMSDPRVEVDVIVDPNLGIDEIKTQKTETKKETLNPIYHEMFEFSLDRDAVESPYTVLRFTVKDVDLLSRNDFMGEALLPISKLPGIAPHQPLPQPMTLQLRSIEKREKNPYLLVLKSRKWESESQQFVSSQLNRSVEDYGSIK